MTALVLGTAEAGTFETRHNHLGAGHILAKVAHNLHILVLCCWHVGNCVLFSMETGDKTAERREMAAVKEGNCTLAADDIDWCLSQIDCLCKWHVLNIYPVILNCHHHGVVSHIGYQMEPYSLSSVKILSLTYSVKQR
jgi:hypothetical protein